MLKNFHMDEVGIQALTFFTRPVVRMLLFALALLIAAYLVYAFGYTPLTKDAELSGAVSVQQVKLNESDLQHILVSSDERARSVGQNFSAASAIFSHAITE